MSVLTRMKGAHSGASIPVFDPVRYWEDRHRSFCGSIRAVGNPQMAEESNSLEYEVKRSQILDLIQAYVPAPVGKHLLDAGCGTGVLTSAFVDMGFDVVGVDFSPTAVRQARQRPLNAEFVVAPLEGLELGRRFDVITVVDVLLHVVREKQLRKSIAALAKHLQTHGVIILFDYLHDVSYGPERHMRHRSMDWYRWAFAAAGLRAVEHRGVYLEREGVTKDLLAIRHINRP